ncbi:MAG TPA: HNH endonuclease signature motif containing protein [Candidatus Eisenbacteria bacterium]|nr:HNH endonuclease signature motif containing protein [Candidatus Eisenbacteria bacterium]
MKNYSLSHLSNEVLLREVVVIAGRARTATAELLAHIAEIDERKLYLPAGYASMHAYCIGELKLSEEMTSKRVAAARAARQFPVIFAMVADGRLSLSAIAVLRPLLTQDDAEDLLAVAAGKTRLELEQLVAERFPRLELTTGLAAVPTVDHPVCQGTGRSSPGTIYLHPKPPVREVEPVAPERFTLQVTIDRATHDLLRQAQDLLGHQVPHGDLGAVLGRVLRLGVAQLEKRRLGATDRPRTSPRPSASARHIPLCVRRAVWARDEGKCTFAGESGHRCAEKRGLEFDHIEPVARGGRTTVENLRLRCRAHNQYEAERVFGTGFMNQKREAARRARERVEEVAHCLRQLRYRAHEARRAAEFSDSIPSAPLEERVKRALTWFAPRVTAVATGCGTSASTVPRMNRPDARS